MHAARPDGSLLSKMFSWMLENVGSRPGVGPAMSDELLVAAGGERQEAQAQRERGRPEKPARHCVTAFTTSVPTMSSCPLPQSSVQSTL